MEKINTFAFERVAPGSPEAVQFCFDFAKLAYQSQEAIEREIQALGYFDVKLTNFASELTSGFVIVGHDLIVVAFRGSVTLQEWLNNCNIWLHRTECGRVHGGFWRAVKGIRAAILEIVQDDLRPGIGFAFVGHSRGGALAQLFQFLFAQDLLASGLGKYPTVIHAFGAPRFCDADFAVSVRENHSGSTPVKSHRAGLAQSLGDFLTNIQNIFLEPLWILWILLSVGRRGWADHAASSYEVAIKTDTDWARVKHRMKAVVDGNDLAGDEERILQEALGPTKLTVISKRRLQIEMQAWQKRREETRELFRRFLDCESTSEHEVDALLADFESRPFWRTPLENLEILSVLHVPREGFAKCMQVVVANAVLGWYDALRFASESGRAEIIEKEALFKMPLTLGGRDFWAADFLQSDSMEISKALSSGFLIAEKFKEVAEYDRHWPSAFGLEPIIRHFGAFPTENSVLPEERWPGAWEAAKVRVRKYFAPAAS
ncbi:hypothetical protein THICB1_70368 [Thiomonas arsenitoxydans]|uniref:Fungal lipase-type domain-containing protein n=1 Tax=Thiomonas arsenitoxydans (strain DSM 22701 / CIP 110005 / 3As) TaxID=426114 RepID=A0ABP1Z930_THIA3|nr:lipase family protein [Thiomonas arsenitoxydans]CQR38248.1 hypothetical protein THICB1_70368 [Thiomonas arsenitoxydans]CQR39192.1 hypothetical protein THICB6_60373 [Thiomonas arsenitoxydans]